MVRSLVCNSLKSMLGHRVARLVVSQERNTERHPPGDEIYRKDNISMFEVDGSKNKMYCQVSSSNMESWF
jgi:hypothetical protein